MFVARGDQVLRISDRYALEQQLAAGGMGEVFLATDERLGRKVAVKVLAPALAESPDFVERFRREALTAASLGHPNIAQVYDHGVDNGSHFIVMEYVSGGDLARLLHARGRLEPDEAVRIAEQVCDALGAAHRAGVVHRDIKPGNVIINAEGRVKVTDFGIARALGQSSLTQAGVAMGTPAYIAPEVARGEAADPASDVYSVGILLYQMLAGAVPFEGDSPVAVALRHLTEQVPPPSARVPGVPAHLDALVARATAPSAADRFSDADAMARALRLGAPVGAATTQRLDAAAPDDRTRVLDVADRAAATSALPKSPSPSSDVAPRPGHPNRRLHGLFWVIGGAVVALLLTLGFGLLSGGESPSANTAQGQRTATSAGASTKTAPTPKRTRTPEPVGPVVPANLVGLDKDQAKQALEHLGVDVRTVDVRAPADKGQVLATFPEAGQSVHQGQTVLLVVSRGGSGDEQGGSAWVVPSWLIGAPADGIRGQLPGRDVRVLRESIGSTQAAGTVIATYPAPGEPVTGRQLLLITSSGPAGD